MVNLPPFCTTETTFCDFWFVVLRTKSPSKKVYFKRMIELFEVENYFLFENTPFQKRDRTILTELPSTKVYQFALRVRFKAPNSSKPVLLTVLYPLQLLFALFSRKCFILSRTLLNFYLVPWGNGCEPTWFKGTGFTWSKSPILYEADSFCAFMFVFIRAKFPP